MDAVTDPRSLLGLSPASQLLHEYLKQLAHLSASKELPTPDIKSYSDALYKNYYPFGLSLMFIAKDGSKSIKNIDANNDNLVLDSIDIYNSEPGKVDSTKASSSSQEYAPYPASNLVISLLPGTVQDKPRPKELVLARSSTGKEILIVLGEPDRKGGGAGPSSGSICIWCEWTKDGIMIEFGGADAKGPDAWERGKDAIWRVLTHFRPYGGMKR